MKIEVVPLAGLILGVLFFDQKWQDQEEQNLDGTTHRQISIKRSRLEKNC